MIADHAGSYLGLPMRKTGAAVPWSVPPDPFSATRRPNSLNTMVRTWSAASLGVEVGLEGLDRVAELPHEVRMTSRLASVGVEPAEGRVVDPGGHPVADHRGNEPQLIGERIRVDSLRRRNV